ncbi:hypothetical protein G8770_15180 [Aestuariicella hydrocarbonica]|uniref:HTH luxR-type domain-containing protein n=1 Tax=Pseudomaricurvus hydrocarbonicus TaxID=1470433 RepID=A0A9E5MMC2_9GAMM|nr:LuxR C-terminal-related transcriptional regulator [Aestuariicella hydrocarbonica]NHO66893.1 hypothetical protein [Aestuariicella hydrocarbonica]
MSILTDTQAFSELVHSLYGAATTSNTNKYFLTQLKKQLNLLHATLITRLPSPTDSGLIYTSGDEADVAILNSVAGAYTNLYAQDPLVNLPLEQVVTLSDTIASDALEDHEYYQLILKPLDIFYIAGADWLQDDHNRMSIRLVRSHEQGDFSQQERQFLSLLIPHLKQSVIIGLQLRQLDTERQIYADSISKRSIGMVTFDSEGNILKTNKAADTFLKHNDGISRVHQHIKIDHTSRNNTLQQYIREAVSIANAKYRSAINALSVSRPSNRADYQLVIKPLPVEATDASSLTPYAALFIKDPDKDLVISVRTLMNLYNLTLSEATIAILMAEGYTTEAVCEELDIKKNTVRAHLRAMYAKTGVTQQSLLVSLVLNSLAAAQ